MNEFGLVTNSFDPMGYGTTNLFDEFGRLRSSIDALGHPTVYRYNVSGLLSSTTDPIGTVSANTYDSVGNLSSTALLTIEAHQSPPSPVVTYTINVLSTNSFGYDDNGNQTISVTWRRVNGVWSGATNRAIFDGANRLVGNIDPLGFTNLSILDSAGQTVASVDKMGRTNRAVFDFVGHRIQHFFSDSTYTSAAFDANGNQTNGVDQLGRTTTLLVDALGRQIGMVFADNTTNWSIPDDLGRLAYTVDGRGTTNRVSYNSASQQIAVTNAVGTDAETWATFGFDLNGNNTTLTNTLGVVNTNLFDVLNRQISVLYPNNTRSSAGFDGAGRLVAQTNEDNVVTLFAYDGAGRLVSVTNATGTVDQAVTRYDFDEAGNLLRQIDALNRTNTFVCDDLGRRTLHTMPDGNLVERFAYDTGGNLVLHTNFNGTIITNQYDTLSRLTNRTSANGYQATFKYSATGVRTNMTDLSGTTSYYFDSQDRLTNKVVAWIGGPTLALNYRFDADGNVTNLWSSSSGGVSNAFQYDAQNRLTNVFANGSLAAEYRFDRIGNLEGMRYGNDITNQFLYDRLSRLTNMVWKVNGSSIASFQYQLGLAGNRTNLNETVNGTTRSIGWGFDSLYRLKRETFSGSTSGTLAYGYDSVGNRTNRTVTGSLGLTNQAFSFNTNDWLVSEGYDPNGNTTNSSGNGYQYDALNHMTNGNNGAVLVTYDGDGNRVKKSVGGTTTFYLIDDVNPSGYTQVLEEWTAMSGAATLNAIYNYGLRLLNERRPSISTNYFLYDGHGSTRVLARTDGSVANAFTFEAYGVLIGSNASPQTTYLYAGEQFDPDSDAYYLRARLCRPETGRFLTRDEAEGSPDRPSSLHRYSFCENNPIDNVDPSGAEIEIALVTLSISDVLFAASAKSESTAKTTAIAPLKDRPKAKDKRQLVAAIFGESGTPSSKAGEDAVEKLAIGATILNQAYYAKLPDGAKAGQKNYNRSFGDGTVLGAIKKSIVAYRADQWNKIATADDLKMNDLLDKTLVGGERRHYNLSIEAANALATPPIPIKQLGNRKPIGFNKSEKHEAPSKDRDEYIGSAGSHVLRVQKGS